jgi:hypothetical protein
MTDLTPDAALARLAAMETRHEVRGRKQMKDTLDDAKDVADVYDLCRAAKVSALDWLADHWQMKPRKAQLLRRLHDHRDILPGGIQPSAAMLLVAEEADEFAVNQILALIREALQDKEKKRKVTVDEVKVILRAPVLARATGELSKYLLARHEERIKGKEIAAELRSIAEAMDDAVRNETVDADDTYALSALFTRVVQDYTDRRQQAHIDAEHGPRIVLFSRWQAGDNGGAFPVQDVPAELRDADGKVCRLIVEVVAA